MENTTEMMFYMTQTLDFN